MSQKTASIEAPNLSNKSIFTATNYKNKQTKKSKTSKQTNNKKKNCSESPVVPAVPIIPNPTITCMWEIAAKIQRAKWDSTYYSF